MATEIRNKADLLLALLFAGETKASDPQRPTAVAGVTRLEKLLFLLKHEAGFLAHAPSNEGFNFVPFKMGPWTQEVYDEVDFLESLGLLSKKRGKRRPAADVVHDDELFDDMVLDKYERNERQGEDESEVFQLTDAGKKKAKALWDRLPKEERENLVQLKRRYNGMSLRQLLRYVYRKYPEFTTESEIREYLGLCEG